MFKIIKNDNVIITAVLMAAGVIIAFLTMFFRLASCDAPVVEPKTDFTFKIDDISYITLKQSKAQVKLKLPSLPVFSKEWQESPYLLVNWRIKTRAGEEYSGQSQGLLAPPYNTFIFSIQNPLEEKLGEVHSEELFIWEYRIRIVREITDLWVEITHPETGAVLDTFHRRYAPEERKDETWAL